MRTGAQCWRDTRGAGTVIHSPQWRERDLRCRLQVWEPLIGRQATMTAARGLWLGQAGMAMMLLWMVLTFTLGVTDSTGWPIAATSAVLFPLVLYFMARSLRLIVRAQREASLVAGTSPKARPPVRDLESFERWQARSQYSRDKTIRGKHEG